MDYALTGPIEDLLEQVIPERSINAMVHCPFHEDRTPSFSIHLDDGVWHCFSCEESGTLNGLYRRLGRDVDLGVRLYQAKQRTEAPIIQTINFAAKSNADLRGLQDPRGSAFLDDFLTSRGIQRTSAKRYGLGYDADRNALAFPYVGLDSRVEGIKYRYQNGFKASESGSRYGLYGLNEVVGKGKVIICEGESDTLSTHSRYGTEYGVGGTSGASVSDTQWSRFGLHLLFARRIYLAYDADEAGDRCAETALRVLGDDKCRRLRPTRGKDISEHLLDGGTLEEIGLE